MKQPEFAGIMYEKAKTLLDKQITDLFLHKKGPGALPLKKVISNTKAIIVPHYNYNISGPVSAWAYKELAESGLKDLYIIISQNHNSSLTGLTTETFETPFGLIRVDQHFARNLLQKKHITESRTAFEQDFTVETQLPFLQFVFKKQLEKIKILPIMLSKDISRSELRQLAIDIKEVIVDMNKDVSFIVTSNLTMYGSKYGFIPFTGNIQKNIQLIDEKLINLIKSFKSDEFLDFVEKELLTVCGAKPIYLLLNLLKKCDVYLEQYYTSYEFLKNPKESVSFASLTFKY